MRFFGYLQAFNYIQLGIINSCQHQRKFLQVLGGDSHSAHVSVIQRAPGDSLIVCHSIQFICRVFPLRLKPCTWHWAVVDIMIRIEVDMFSFFFSFREKCCNRNEQWKYGIIVSSSIVETLKFPYHLIGPGRVEQKRLTKQSFSTQHRRSKNLHLENFSPNRTFTCWSHDMFIVRSLSHNPFLQILSFHKFARKENNENWP